MPVDSIEAKIIARRLKSFIESEDSFALGDAMLTLSDRYGMEVVSEVVADLSCESSWLMGELLNRVPADKKHLLSEASLEFLADQLQEFGLKIEDNLRVSDEGFWVSRAAVRMIAVSGYPNVADFGQGLDDLSVVGICRSPFVHDLSEVYEGNTNYMNCWAVASVFISEAMGWLTPGDPAPIVSALVDAVSQVAPTVDTHRLMAQARYDDRALLRLCGYVANGIETKVAKALDAE